MSGGGIGGALGTGLGALLAPETGGMSLLAPALGGAVGGYAGSAVTGGSNPLSAGLMSGLGGLGTGVMSGLLGVTDPSSGSDGGILGSIFGPSSNDGSPASQVAQDVGSGVVPSGASQYAADTAAQAIPPQSLGNSVSVPGAGMNHGNIAGVSSPNSSASSTSSVLPYLGLGAAALGALMPRGSNPVNVSGNASAVQSTAPGYSSNLPTYNYNSAQTPYTGNWYTYGLRPESPLAINTLTPTGSKRGGLMHFSNGGQATNPLPQHKPLVPSTPQIPPLRNLTISDIADALPKGVLGQSSNPLQIMQTQSGNFYDHARGGLIPHMQMGGIPPIQPMNAGPAPGMFPQGAPPQTLPMQHPAPKQNPLQAIAQFQMGHKIGRALRAHIQGQTPPGRVQGSGGGQDDAIPAKLSDGEYIVPSEVVSQLGDGSTKSGGDKLDNMVSHVRAHKTSHGSKFPPKAKNPLSYLHASS